MSDAGLLRAGRRTWWAPSLGLLLLVAVSLSATAYGLLLILIPLVILALLCIEFFDKRRAARAATSLVISMGWRRPRGRMLLAGAASGVLIWVVGVICTSTLGAGTDPTSRDSAAVLTGQSGSASDALGLLFYVLLYGPVMEEAVFRGLALGLLARVPRPVPLLIPVLLTSAGFALAHHYDLAGIITVFVCGLGYCSVRIVAGEVWSSTVSHGVYNALTAAHIVGWISL